MHLKKITQSESPILPFGEDLLNDIGTFSDFDDEAYARMSARIDRGIRRQHASKCDD